MVEQWTPGGWRWLGNWLVPVSPTADAILTYTTADDGLHGTDADKALIASAPDLYEALKRADALIEGLWKSVPWGQTFDLDIAALNEVPIAIKRALAKAAGTPC